MTDTGQADCERLPWDSEHFGIRIARARSPRLTEELSTRIDAWCRENGVDCLYFSCDPGDRESVRLAERDRFRFVDLRTTFFRPLTGAPTGARDRSRLATAADAAWVVQLARGSFEDTRFYFDGGFERERCDLLYEIWARKALADETQAVWLGQLDGQSSGFVTCQRDASTGVGSIGLIAVAPDFRGRGVGDDLVTCAASHLGETGMTGVRVVTQARNVRALRLYERSGFLVESIRLTYHKWYDTSKERP